jgi:hypothetical protein
MTEAALPDSVEFRLSSGWQVGSLAGWLDSPERGSGEASSFKICLMLSCYSSFAAFLNNCTQVNPT